MYYEYPLNIQNGLNYARRWAYSRNPEYYDFDTLGGDCTNFVSQCIYAEGAVMNYTKDTGWYYISLNDRAAAWTGVEYFCRFIINNKGTGPFGELVPLYNAQSGDVIQLGGDMGFYHSLYVISVINGIIYVAAHTNDTYARPLDTYLFDKARCIHIIGARRYINR